MSKEWLEEIKIVENWDNLNEWQFKQVARLIEQAELMQRFSQKNGELNEFLTKYSEPKHLGINVIDVAMDIITEQAERLQELEDKLYTVNESAYVIQMDFLDANGKRNALADENNRYRDALEFYEDESNYDYRVDGDGEFVWVESNIMNDSGEIARKSLEGESSDE